MGFNRKGCKIFGTEINKRKFHRGHIESILLKHYKVESKGESSVIGKTKVVVKSKLMDEKVASVTAMLLQDLNLSLPYTVVVNSGMSDICLNLVICSGDILRNTVHRIFISNIGMNIPTNTQLYTV